MNTRQRVLGEAHVIFFKEGSKGIGRNNSKLN
jgi:hypothetical protein